MQFSKSIISPIDKNPLSNSPGNSCNARQSSIVVLNKKSIEVGWFLNKRIIFLDQMIEQLNLNNVNTIHGRAEDYGQDINYREKYSNKNINSIQMVN